MPSRLRCLLAPFFGVLLMAGCALPSKPARPTVTQAASDTSAPLRFVVSFPQSARATPLSGRILLFLSRTENGEPRNKVDWFDPDPMYAIDVTNLAPGTAVTFDPAQFRSPTALAYPEPMGRLKAGTYHAQVVIDHDQTRRDFNEGPGNLYSAPRPVALNGEKGGTHVLVADQVIQEKRYEDSDWVKFVSIRSPRLSEFHGREVSLQAAVLLPFGYAEEPDRRYPARYVIPGFGGRHDGLARFAKGSSARWTNWSTGRSAFRGFEIVLDPDVPLGHSVFANSANNGPVGDALVQELIPAIESRFRILAEPRARFVTGHSSGGWSSLWLQVAYPDFFGGCWSTAPDPVDFRAFQTMNLYQDRNGHWTPAGIPRPLARTRFDTRVNFTQFNLMEYVLGYGGQLDSFDAVFSPRGADRRPLPVMNKLTGTIDPTVAEAWKRYDIRLILEERWKELGPRLQGKLHIYGGAWDTFYLEPALELLKAFLDTQDHGGRVEILPGDHGSFMTDAFRTRLDEEMAAQLKKNGVQ